MDFNLRKVGEEKAKEKSYDGKFNIKEISYLLNIMENIDHNGKMLEQALSCVLKLKDSLDKLTKHTE